MIFPKVAVLNSIEQIAKSSFIVCMVQRIIIFTSRKFVARYVHSTLQKKVEFLQECQFWFGRLSILLW